MQPNKQCLFDVSLSNTTSINSTKLGQARWKANNTVISVMPNRLVDWSRCPQGQTLVGDLAALHPSTLPPKSRHVFSVYCIYHHYHHYRLTTTILLLLLASRLRTWDNEGSSFFLADLASQSCLEGLSRLCSACSSWSRRGWKMIDVLRCHTYHHISYPKILTFRPWNYQCCPKAANSLWTSLSLVHHNHEASEQSSTVQGSFTIHQQSANTYRIPHALPTMHLEWFPFFSIQLFLLTLEDLRSYGSTATAQAIPTCKSQGPLSLP